MCAPPTFHNKNKYYHFHHDDVHTIGECIQLKDEIENVICHGYLEKYMHQKECRLEVAVSKKTPNEFEIDNRSTEGRVNMISWGACSGGKYRGRCFEEALKQ